MTILSLAQNSNVIVTTGPAGSRTCPTPQVEAQSVEEEWYSTSCQQSTRLDLKIGGPDPDTLNRMKKLTTTTTSESCVRDPIRRWVEVDPGNTFWPGGRITTPLQEFSKTFRPYPTQRWPQSWSSVGPHLLATVKLRRNTFKCSSYSISYQFCYPIQCDRVPWKSKSNLQKQNFLMTNFMTP